MLSGLSSFHWVMLSVWVGALNLPMYIEYIGAIAPIKVSKTQITSKIVAIFLTL